MPEFLNRIDETIIFHPLGRRELSQIVEFQLKRLEKQLAEAGLTLRVTDAAKAELAEEGFDPAYGARPLKRVIQQRLANPLATALLEHKINDGDVVEIDFQATDFVFNPAKSSEKKQSAPLRRCFCLPLGAHSFAGSVSASADSVRRHPRVSP